MTDDTYNAADPKQVKRRADKAKLAREQVETDLKELLELPAFRRYVWRHMHDTCGLMRDPFNPNGSVLNLNIGMQSVARVLWAEIENTNPDAIPTMMIEYKDATK